MVKSLIEKIKVIINRIVNFIKLKLANKEDMYVTNDTFTVWKDIRTCANLGHDIPENVEKVEQRFKKITIADKGSKLVCIKRSDADLTLNTIKIYLKYNVSQIHPEHSMVRLVYLINQVTAYSKLEKMAEAIISKSITKDK